MIRDIILAHGDDPALAGMPPYQRAALDAIASCGTVAAGMHREVCDHCGDRRLVPNTCGNRSCPHCQGRERIVWVEARTAELLPCGYHHVVLTIPSQLRPAAKAFPRAFLGSLLKAASDVIDRLCRDPRYLGAEVGQLAVLHTWTRNLEWHPHVHIIVTAGGWDADHHRWVPAKTYGSQKRPFLMPVDVLRSAFARRLRTLLLRQARAGAFGDGGGLAELADATALAKHLDVLMAKPWVVRIEPPFGGPQTLLKYLGAYVSRTAIGPKRVTYDSAAGTATFTWRANATPEQEQSTTLPAVEFIKRFAQHILPPRFQRIRFRGLWSTAHRATKLDLARKAIDSAAPPPPKPAPHEPRCDPCPVCGQGRYQRIPGSSPRPPRRERARLLALIRSGELHPTYGRATTAA